MGVSELGALRLRKRSGKGRKEKKSGRGRGEREITVTKKNYRRGARGAPATADLTMPCGVGGGVFNLVALSPRTLVRAQQECQSSSRILLHQLFFVRPIRTPSFPSNLRPYRRRIRPLDECLRAVWSVGELAEMSSIFVSGMIRERVCQGG